jgi:hypothetical protein
VLKIKNERNCSDTSWNEPVNQILLLPKFSRAIRNSGVVQVLNFLRKLEIGLFIIEADAIV